MSSVWPGAFDTLAEDQTDSTLQVTRHAAEHAKLADAIKKMQTNLDVNPQGNFPTVKARLAKPDVAVFSRPGALSVLAGAGRFVFPFNATLQDVRAAVGSPPVGAAVIIDVNKNGSTIFTTQGNRPQIAIGANISAIKVPDVLSVVAGDYFTVDVDQAGGVAGTSGQLGKNDIGANSFTLVANEERVFAVSVPTGGITVSTGWIYLTGAVSVATHIKFLIYDDNGAAAPGALLYTSNEVTLAAGAAASWVPFTFGTSPVLTAGPKYFGWIADTAGGATKYVASGGPQFVKGVAYATPADPFGTPNSTGAFMHSVYVDYTTSGSGSVASDLTAFLTYTR